ncbi:MAG: hypothetical protein DME31_04920 [Verrucomicrobia bacterium]|nr:MAG: hypothetical protein DME31_04920 [Verrucomicrobiota bacterium]
MKTKSTSQSAFFNLRILIASVFCVTGVFIGLGGARLYSAPAKAQPTTNSAGGPKVVRMVGPAVMNTDLRNLPYVPPSVEIEGPRLTRYPFPLSGRPGKSETSAFSQSLLENILTPIPNMPPPLLTFDGTDRPTSGCNCRPPDTNGDVGPNHYLQTVNTGFRVFDKSGTPLTPFITYNSFFTPLGTGNPCGNNQNDGDPFAFYDQVADRWVVSDFAFPGFPGPGPFYQCIGVSQTPDPVAGPWFLYAVLVDPVNLNDYPKMALWNNPQPGGAYFLTQNLFNGTSQAFAGVSVFALDRGSMLTGGPAHAISFMIPPGDPGLGNSYSLVAANFRTGAPPPAGRDEMLLAVDSPSSGGVSLTQVKAWKFHVDFVTPANSTLGVGPNHAPNSLITVNPFVDAFTNTTSNLVPQPGGNPPLDTLGDKIMTPVVYQFRNGVESLWADQTIILNYPNGPTAVRWYQFDVTGGNFPAAAAQQQDWSNGNDGVWRFMPAIAVDANGNTAIGYSISSSTIFPGIRYAGRFASDPLNNLGQGEAVMTNGTGAQTSASGRWGDYSMTTLDPDGTSFWHTNEYYVTTSSLWSTRVGKFGFPQPRIVPSPRPRPTPRPR